MLLNAGVLGQRTMLDNYHWDTWQKVMQINVNSQFILMKHLLPLLHKAPADASVIFTSSSVGRQAPCLLGRLRRFQVCHRRLNATVAEELENTSRIRVNSINPGGTRTGMRNAAYPAENPASVPTADTIMPLYLYLMSPDSIGTHAQSLDARDWVAANT